MHYSYSSTAVQHAYTFRLLGNLVRSPGAEVYDDSTISSISLLFVSTPPPAFHNVFFRVAGDYSFVFNEARLPYIYPAWYAVLFVIFS